MVADSLGRTLLCAQITAGLDKTQFQIQEVWGVAHTSLHFYKLKPVWLWPCFKRQAFMALKLVLYSLLGEELM